ncbi:unnamed protein product [Allacma fusca]|uniref:Malectin domain-containing protein n=1 Tax=Allacma fusca TaxID=39272 RepID=A0A8J2PW32_9HEXA|nr:unnamed protein product [Allacma fusca]
MRTLTLFLSSLSLKIKISSGEAKFQPQKIGSQVVYAVNVGGGGHTDINGINYIRDPLPNNELSEIINWKDDIHGVDLQDRNLYRTARSSVFGYTYNFPEIRDGSYVLVLQFCELSDFQIGRRAFSIRLDEYMIFPRYDIYSRAGFATAHQEVIPFTVSDSTKILEINREVFDIDEKTLSLRFLSVRTPPLISAFYILNGTVEEIPKLPARKINPENSPGKYLVYAVNAGGKSHTDANGIHYQEDPLVVGFASDQGLRMDIQGTSVVDAYLYQTERYAYHSFGYDIPVTEDGTYLVVLKFSEVSFHTTATKVFNIRLNGKHMMQENLDIFEKAGFATAHDVMIVFKVSNSVTVLSTGYDNSGIKDGKVFLEFQKGLSDNPKINAFFVLRGKMENIRMLQSSTVNSKSKTFDENFFPDIFNNQGDKSIKSYHEDLWNSRRKVSGPVSPDPWKNASFWTIFFPLFFAVLASAMSVMPFAKGKV